MQTKTIKIRNIKGRVEDNILSKTGMAVSVSHGMAGISRQVAYTYDAIGRLTGKQRQLTGTGKSACQYAYDVHGWPRSVKEGEFRQQLYYADGLDGGCWNGNISTVKWKTDGNSSWQGYNLRYDGAGRLQSAVFGSGDNLTSYRGYFSESAEYDSDGNVTGLRRRGLTDNLHGGFSYVDRLCMTYEGNRLVSVRDSASRLPYANATDFDGVTGREYALAYNGAGALVSDEGRGMARVDYDLMGNPLRIQFTDGSVTRYIYSTAGEKLRVVHLTAVPNITVAMGQTRELAPSEILSADSTDYLLGGTLTMRDGRIDRYLFDEGYCQASKYAPNPAKDTFMFHYYDRDHLGSVRQVILANGTNKGTLVQKMDYYPSGLLFCDGNSDGDVQPVRFSGKELDKMHGLGTYDFGARQYNPIVGRWGRMDPLAEKYYGISPYAYCGNNPMNAVDPDRKKVVDSKGRNIFYLNRNGVPQISKYASSNDRMVYEGMMLTKTGQKLLKQMVRSTTSIHLEYADVCQDDNFSNITYAETFQGRKGKDNGIYMENNIYKLKDATITFYMKNIENSLTDSHSENYGYTMIEAMGAEGTHESVHAADPDEVHKDIKSANGGPERSEEDYERKARKVEQDFRNELKKERERQ